MPCTECGGAPDAAHRRSCSRHWVKIPLRCPVCAREQPDRHLAGVTYRPPDQNPIVCQWCGAPLERSQADDAGELGPGTATESPRDPGPSSPAEWLCPVCGAVVADDLLAPSSPRPPVHVHYGHVVELVERPQLSGDRLAAEFGPVDADDCPAIRGEFCPVCDALFGSLEAPR